MAEKNSPIRLALVLQDLEFGGTQRQVLRLAAHLDKTRFAPELWIMQSGGGFIPEAQAIGIPIRFLTKARRVGIGSLVNLWRTMKKQRPEIIVAFTAVPNIWCRILGRMTGMEIIVGTCRGGGSVRRQKERLLWRLAHHHICNAPSLRSNLVKQLGIPAHRVSLCTNGIDISQPQVRTGPPPGKRILSIGRLVEDKDQATLIKAFALTLKTHPDAQLTLVGDGQLRPRLQRLADSLGIDEKVFFMPGSPDVSAFYENCDLFALSSRTEASPNVLLEAAAAGLPVAATRVGGIPEMVIHEKTGLLVDRESPEIMAQAISRLLANPDLCRSMGEAGREHVHNRFSVQNMVDCHSSILSTLHDQMRG